LFSSIFPAQQGQFSEGGWPFFCAAEADALRVSVVEDFEGVAVEDEDDLTLILRL
jgi:hypothetical protein